MWYRALCLRYGCIRSSGIIVTPYATFAKFRLFVAKLAHGKNCILTQSRTHAYLMPREPKLGLLNQDELSSLRPPAQALALLHASVITLAPV